MKQSQVCRVLRIDHKTLRYTPKKQKDDEMIKTLLLDYAHQFPHYGFKTLYGLIRQAGHTWNHKRIWRIYCELQLNLKRKPKKRLAPRTAMTLVTPAQQNDTWSLDYMSDALIDGRRFRTANVIDDYRRSCLGIAIHFSLPARRITQWLDQLAKRCGYPKNIRVDNGPENISDHFRSWAEQHRINIQFIQPGKPAQNAYIERFNRTYREAILDQYAFDDLDEVRHLTQRWIQHYNYERPHQALGMQPPILEQAA